MVTGASFDISAIEQSHRCAAKVGFIPPGELPVSSHQLSFPERTLELVLVLLGNEASLKVDDFLAPTQRSEPGGASRLFRGGLQGIALLKWLIEGSCRPEILQILPPMMNHGGHNVTSNEDCLHRIAALCTARISWMLGNATSVWVSDTLGTGNWVARGLLHGIGRENGATVIKPEFRDFGARPEDYFKNLGAFIDTSSIALAFAPRGEQTKLELLIERARHGDGPDAPVHSMFQLFSELGHSASTPLPTRDLGRKQSESRMPTRLPQPRALEKFMRFSGMTPFELSQWAIRSPKSAMLLNALHRTENIPISNLAAEVGLHRSQAHHGVKALSDLGAVTINRGRQGGTLLTDSGHSAQTKLRRFNRVVGGLALPPIPNIVQMQGLLCSDPSMPDPQPSDSKFKVEAHDKDAPVSIRSEGEWLSPFELSEWVTQNLFAAEILLTFEAGSPQTVEGLANRFGVRLNSVSKALTHLKNQGLIEATKGVGACLTSRGEAAQETLRRCNSTIGELATPPVASAALPVMTQRLPILISCRAEVES